MTDYNIVPTQDLAGAAEMLDTCVDSLRQIQASGFTGQ